MRKKGKNKYRGRSNSHHQQLFSLAPTAQRRKRRRRSCEHRSYWHSQNQRVTAAVTEHCATLTWLGVRQHRRAAAGTDGRCCSVAFRPAWFFSVSGGDWWCRWWWSLSRSCGCGQREQRRKTEWRRWLVFRPRHATGHISAAADRNHYHILHCHAEWDSV